MVDSGTGLAALGAGIGGKDIIVKLLGPTAEYIGGGLKEFTEKRVNNVKNIFSKASKKLGDNIDKDGQVPPIVLRGIIEDGSWNDNEIASEYFGGVLASSRSEVSRDDRGAYFNKLITSLSTYQLRAHYFIYSFFKYYFNGQNINFGIDQGRKEMKLLIPFETIALNLEVNEKEADEFYQIFDHIIQGLIAFNLIDNTYYYGNIDFIKTHYSEANNPGLLISPSTLGVTLFLWAHGKGYLNKDEFLNKDIKFTIEKSFVNYDNVEITYKKS